MRIGLLTLWGDFNYGNRFQNYAIQTICESLGAETTTIVPFESVCVSALRWLYRFSRFPFHRQLILRKLALRRFSVRRIHKKTVYVPFRRLPRRLCERFDAFITGSDQVWNPELKQFRYDYFFLRFAEDAKKICLSPSLGVREIPPSWEARFRAGLEGFRNLSCREEAGAAEIARLTGRECQVLIDPVLALSPDAWRAMEDGADVPQEPYVLLFFLGTRSRAANEAADFLRSNFTLIDANHEKSRYYSASPEKLLALIDRASMVLTDSFHMTALSILFNAPFLVFDRVDSPDSPNAHMNSRIATLTSKFRLQSRYVTDETPFSTQTLSDACDFVASNAILEAEREKFYSYLSDCIRGAAMRGGETAPPDALQESRK